MTTNETIKELRKLDEWIHENVMGKCVFDEQTINNSLCRKCGRECSDNIHRIKSPTHDAAAAMEVLKRCVEKLGWDDAVSIGQTADGDYCVVTFGISVESKTLELAICLFAKEVFK